MSPHVQRVVILGVVLATSALVLLFQHVGVESLRIEVAALREVTCDAERLRAENRRLCAVQVPEPELERLRADHAALPRLRAEIEGLKARAAATGR